MKRILFLGGSTQQIPVITYANSKGYYTILCDYLSDNPGQHHADKFYLESTTDKESILKVAVAEKIDGILAYASDPAAPTAAWVAEKLGLPTNPFKSVEILSYKHKFREFLRDNCFCSPQARSYKTLSKAKREISSFTFPLMVKPVDSSGSKGVSKIEDETAFENAFLTALEYSRCKTVIVEEYIIMDHPYMIGGDCFILEGKVLYWGLLNSHRDLKVDPLVPVGTSYPPLISDGRLTLAKQTIQRLADKLDLRFGGFNLEIMFDANDNAYVIEMGPRNGGNMIPDLLQMIHGVDMIAASVEAALGHAGIELSPKRCNKLYSTMVLHSETDGTLKQINYLKGIESKIVKEVIYTKPGEPVYYFDGANKALGIIFLMFDSLEEELEIMNNHNKYIEIVLE